MRSASSGPRVGRAGVGYAGLPDPWTERSIIDPRRGRPRAVAPEDEPPADPPPASGSAPPAAAPAPWKQTVPGDAARYLSRHSKSFRWAALFFPASRRRAVADLYAFCRFTDDLTDEPGGGGRRERERQLDRWLSLAREAYEGEPTGVALVDRAMADMAAAGVPFRHVSELVEGMRMDLRPRTYGDLEELDLYLYRVASVVGLWLSGLFGVRDRTLLARAADLGRAMQLTNILRDVGEDWRRGRLYLPLAALEARGLAPGDIGEMARGETVVLPAYVDLVESLMEEAERRYDAALAVVPDLPPFYQRPVAVAAWVYRGIHDEIRRNGYDNLRRRAYTGPARKAWLTSRALGTLALQRRRWRGLEDWVRRPSDAGPGVGTAPLPRPAPDGLAG